MLPSLSIGTANCLISILRKLNQNQKPKLKPIFICPALLYKKLSRNKIWHLLNGRLIDFLYRAHGDGALLWLKGKCYIGGKLPRTVLLQTLCNQYLASAQAKEEEKNWVLKYSEENIFSNLKRGSNQNWMFNNNLIFFCDFQQFPRCLRSQQEQFKSSVASVAFQKLPFLNLILSYYLAGMEGDTNTCIWHSIP